MVAWPTSCSDNLPEYCSGSPAVAEVCVCTSDRSVITATTVLGQLRSVTVSAAVNVETTWLIDEAL
jgi:hypothetical protein